MGQLATQHGVHPIQVSKWKKHLIDNADSVFEGKNKRSQEEAVGREDLERKIGQLTVELDYLKKKLGT